MPAKLPIRDGEPFIAALEQAHAEGNAEFIERHMARLERLIAQYQDRTFELSKLQYRARQIRELHERPRR